MTKDDSAGDGEPPGDSEPSADGDRSGAAHPPGDGDPSDETVVQTAAAAAEGVIFDRYKQSIVRDLDVTVSFEAGILDVDVYLNVPSAERDDETDPETDADVPSVPDPDVVAEEATLAARDAVDELFGETA